MKNSSTSNHKHIVIISIHFLKLHDLNKSAKNLFRKIIAEKSFKVAGIWKRLDIFFFRSHLLLNLESTWNWSLKTSCGKRHTILSMRHKRQFIQLEKKNSRIHSLQTWWHRFISGYLCLTLKVHSKIENSLQKRVISFIRTVNQLYKDLGQMLTDGSKASTSQN